VQEQVLNGRYRLGDVLGEGGMAVVHRALDLLLNRTVAVKILRTQYATDAGFLKRFDREAQAAASFSHPNIVNVYDVGTDGDQHYIVMEYIRGPSLKELIRRQGPFSVDGAIFVIGQVASALDYAHARGLVHRDIKSQNILVDRDGNAKVVDFGIAKGARDVNLTEAGTGMGTVHYVSPEQAQGEPATPVSDLYSTGVVLFEMLTKRLPFEADTPVAVAMQHVNTPPPPPSTLNASIPPAVDAIVLKALAKDPAERYPSGAALAAALRHWDMPAVVRASYAGATRGVQGSAPDSGTRTLPVDRARTMPPPAPASRPVPSLPRQRTGTVKPPPSGTRPPARTRAAYPPADRAYRDDVGCVTWLIGSAILLGLIGLVALAFRIGPGVFATESNAGETPTTAAALATATSEVTATVTAAAPTATATQPAPNPTATSTATPSPTATVASGAVPSLLNLTMAQAQELIGDRWQFVLVEENNNAVSAGVIFRQTPEGGSQLPLGQTVTAVVSKGPVLVTIPPLAATNADDARDALEGLGFDVEEVDEPSAEVPQGDVIRTEPADAAPAGSTVTLFVSTGPGEDDLVVVPYVYSEDVDDAVDTLEDVGLVVANVAPLSCDQIVALYPDFDCAGFPDDGVVTSTLAWGSEVPRGSPIDITYYDADL
jgi:serine/threonine-protein kinase